MPIIVEELSVEAIPDTGAPGDASRSPAVLREPKPGGSARRALVPELHHIREREERTRAH